MEAARAAMVVALLAVLAMAAAPGIAKAQQQPPSCAQKLIPCATSLNSTKPTETCCSSLKEALTTDLKCMCALLNNKALLANFNVNVTQALQVPKNCGLTSDTSVCNSVNAASPGSSPGAGSSPATPTGNNNSGAHGITWIGMYGLTSLFLCWWSVVA